jgi:hypothetical protein
MNVLLDDCPCQSRAVTVVEAIMEGVREARARGRMVVDVYVDGQLVTERSLASEAFLNSTAREVRLHSVIAAELAKETLQQAAEAVLEADGLQREAAELIQAGRVADAMSRLSRAIAIWSDVQSATVQGSEAAGINVNEVQVDGIAMSRLVETLNGRLRLLRDALSTGDTVTLADTLLYDLPPVVTEWRGMLHELARLADDARLRGAS